LRLDVSQAESAARLQAIQELGLRLDVSQAESAARLQAIQELGLKLDVSQANSAARLEAIQVLGERLRVSEANLVACLLAIERQKNEIKSQTGELEGLRNDLQLIKTSRSWRMTAPLRRLHGRFSAFFQKVGG